MRRRNCLAVRETGSIGRLCAKWMLQLHPARELHRIAAAAFNGRALQEAWSVVPPVTGARVRRAGRALRNLLQRALCHFPAARCLAALLEHQLPIRPCASASETQWPVDPVHHDDTPRELAWIKLLGGFHDQVLSVRTSATITACADRR